MDRHWKKLMKNVEMSSEYGAAGARVLANPKKAGRIRVGNQSTKRHKITITIDDLKDLWEIQKGKCFWLGIDMSLDDLFKSNSPFSVSVDRLDNERDYHRDNIVLTTRFANRGRGSYDNTDFEERLDSLLENRTKEKINLKMVGCVSKKPATIVDFFT
tara:strand:- start:33 stop:506 length:474 start_codon:yes stop_codon:yes gene_type:complete